jgi:predicted nucleotidyltransferase
MTYTEIKKRNGKSYYYRAISIRKGENISKKRIYLGVNLSREDLIIKQTLADKELLSKKIDKTIKNLKFKIIPLLKKNNVKKAGIFGSYSRGEQKKNSDVDIIIEPAENMGFGFVGLQFELEKKLKKKVDLITYNFINPHIKKYILNDEVRILG